MDKVASSIADGTRIPWLNEPACIKCHTGIAEVDTGETLYRNAKGHGNLYCTVCHGSPHSMMPSNQDSDNYQGIVYQNKAKTIASCGVCHQNSKGGTTSDKFSQVHGGTSPAKTNACHICHTSVSSDTAKWPHMFQWKKR